MAGMTRTDAARILGLGPDPDREQVRRAFRTWASLLHPDHGGDPSAFAALCAARDALLHAERVVHAEPVRAKPGPAVDHAVEVDGAPAPRRAWREVLHVPGPGAVAGLTISAVAAVLAVLVADVVALPWGLIPAALASAAWCVIASRSLLRLPDHGHVIVGRTVGWAAITCGQWAVAWAAGIPVVEALPLLAVPFVAVIAAVNPAAGFRRARHLR